MNADVDHDSHNGMNVHDASQALTWAALLGRWVDFARSAVGLPDDAEGQRMRASVPDVIMLQAVWFALRDLDHLPEDEQRLGLDRAELLIRRHVEALADRFVDVNMPNAMSELIDDAQQALARAQPRSGGDSRESPDSAAT